MKIIKKLWGILPLLVMIIFQLLINLYCKINHLQIRQIFFNIVYFLFIISISILLLYIGIILIKHTKKIIYYICNSLLVFLSLFIIFFALMGYAFSYNPEHIINKNGKTMVAVVNSFTDVFVYYYEYKGAFFMGSERIGEEWYGSGGYDPFTTDMTVKPKTSNFKS